MMNAPKTDAELMLTKARTRLLRKLVFFGQLALKLTFVETTQTQTMATDGKHLYYNPVWVATMTVAKLVGVILHEVLHVIFMHMLRREGRQHERWNVACDLAINPIIIRYGEELPEGALDEYRFHRMTAEQIYKALDQEDDWKAACRLSLRARASRRTVTRRNQKEPNRISPMQKRPQKALRGVQMRAMTPNRVIHPLMAVNRANPMPMLHPLDNPVSVRSGMRPVTMVPSSVSPSAKNSNGS